MAHEIKVSIAAANAKAAAWAALLNGGEIRIYEGTKPANADASLGAAVLLAKGVFGNPAFGNPLDGLVTANAITKDSDAPATGTAQFYRLLQSNQTTPVGDGTCGVTGGGFDLEMATVSIVQHGEVTFPTMTHQESLG